MTKRKKAEPVKGYDSWEDVAAKIDWEGGIDSFFNGYLSHEDILDPTLKALAAAYEKAAKALEDYLREKGGLL